MSFYLEIFYFFAFAISCFYAIVILVLSRYLVFTNNEINTNHLKVSVIIPYRNEENNLLHLLQNLKNQSLAKSQFQMVFIDDFSDDLGFNLIENFKTNNPDLDIINLKNNVKGKKNAIVLGIENSKHEIIQCIDADVSFGDDFLVCQLHKLAAEKNCKLLCGAVKINHRNIVFEIFQSMEFMTLIGITAATTALNKAILCNGANLMFYKKDFIDLNPFENNSEIASGDDIFLLKKTVEKFGQKSVFFHFDKKSIVSTFPKENMKEFINQRVRWASKLKYTQQNLSNFLGTLVFTNAFLIFISFFVGLFYPPYFLNFVALFLFKILIDFIFFKRLLSFFDENKLIYYMPVIQVFYIIYVLTIPFFALLGKYEWKGRKFKV
jgi:poly-beta-1,6-N-acetyl-D-glucosamine synthase